MNKTTENYLSIDTGIKFHAKINRGISEYDPQRKNQSMNLFRFVVVGFVCFYVNALIDYTNFVLKKSNELMQLYNIILKLNPTETSYTSMLIYAFLNNFIDAII